MSLTTWMAVVCSCLLWIAGISWVLVHLLGLSAAVGWGVVVILAVLSVAAVGILIHEVRNAIEVPDDVNLEAMGVYSRVPYANSRSSATPLPVDVAPAFRIRS